MARVVGRRGEFTVRVRATATIQLGTVFCSFSFPEVHVNDVTGSGFDPETGTSAFKETPVRLEPVA
jgi:predicted molibdopterin-dependent oxidoreductase YjgC